MKLRLHSRFDTTREELCASTNWAVFMTDSVLHRQIGLFLLLIRFEKRTELMVTLMVKVVRDSEDATVKEALAAKLRAEVKPVQDYLAPPSELPGALRNGSKRKIVIVDCFDRD